MDCSGWKTREDGEKEGTEGGREGTDPSNMGKSGMIFLKRGH